MRKKTTAHEYYLQLENKKDFKDFTYEGLNHLKNQIEKMIENNDGNLSLKTLKEMESKIVNNIEKLKTNDIKSAKEELLDLIKNSNSNLVVDQILN